MTCERGPVGDCLYMAGGKALSRLGPGWTRRRWRELRLQPGQRETRGPDTPLGLSWAAADAFWDDRVNDALTDRVFLMRSR